MSPPVDNLLLEHLIPNCMHGRTIRDRDHVWRGLEQYFADYDVSFSHGLCPSCLAEQHPMTGPPAQKS